MTPPNNFDFTPEEAQALFDREPTHALFRAIDSDDGAGEDYSSCWRTAWRASAWSFRPT